MTDSKVPQDKIDASRRRLDEMDILSKIVEAQKGDNSFLLKAFIRVWLFCYERPFNLPNNHLIWDAFTRKTYNLMSRYLSIKETVLIASSVCGSDKCMHSTDLLTKCIFQCVKCQTVGTDNRYQIMGVGHIK